MSHTFAMYVIEKELRSLPDSVYCNGTQQQCAISDRKRFLLLIVHTFLIFVCYPESAAIRLYAIDTCSIGICAIEMCAIRICAMEMCAIGIVLWR